MKKIHTKIFLTSLLALSLLGLTSTTFAATATINQKAGQADPSSTGTVKFTVVFSSAISSGTFTTSDILTTGSTATGITVDSVTEVSPNDGTTFEVTISATGAGTIVASIPTAVAPTVSTMGTTDNSPYGIVADTSGNIYVANQASNFVTKISSGGIYSAFAHLGRQSDNLAIDSSGNIYAVYLGSTSIVKITPGGATSTFAAAASAPFDITIDSSGNLYTANYIGNSVSKITPGGVSTVLGTVGGATLNPIAVAVDSSGNVYTANYSSNNVTKITPGGATSTLGTTGSGPSGIVVDSSGNVYTANYNANNVTKITPGGVSTTFSTTGSGQHDLVIDTLGNIYSANKVSDNVTKITPSGTATILGSTGISPYNLAIDANNVVYASNQGSDNVTKFTPGAYLYGLSSLSVSSTDNSITYTPSAPSTPSTPYVPPIAPIDTTVRSTGGGSGYVSSYRPYSATPTYFVSPTATPVPFVVTPAACSSCTLATTPISKNKRNSLVEVNKLRTFLNTYENANLVLLGGYNAQDIAAVNKFQLKYKTKILSPYGLTKPTGVVGKNMITQINRIAAGK